MCYNKLMIIIGALAALFLTFFFLKKHVGTAILASFAGVIVNNTISSFYVTLHKTTHLSLDTIEAVAFLALVIALPLIVYFFSKRSWSPVFIRAIGSAIFAVTIISLCSGIISHLVSLDALSKNILSFIGQYRAIISTAGIVIAYFDVLLPHKDYD